MRSTEADPTTLLEIVKAFARVEPNVVLIGGLAIFVHGGAHATEDVDFAFERQTESLRKLVELLEPHHPRPTHFPATKRFDWSVEILQKNNVLTLKWI